MINVSNDFKIATQQVTKDWEAYLVDQGPYPDEITDADDLQALKITGKSSLLLTVMRQLDGSFLGSHDYFEKSVNVGLGIVLADTSTEFIDYGTFFIIEQKDDMGTGVRTIKGYDKMYGSMVAYDLDPIYERTFPCTLSELLEAICTRLGWTLASGSDVFPNDDFTLATDVITGVGLTYRAVLDQIAEASGSIIYFDVNDELTVKQITHDSPLETLDSSILESLTVQVEYGPINSVVLSRYPQEDNIVAKNQGSIDTNGLTEIKVKNNVLVDADRATAAVPMLGELLGLEFYPFEAETNGLGYFQIGDRITVEDLSLVQREVVIFEITTNITGGVSEKYEADIPEKNSTNYQYAGIVGQTIKNTQIIVDKQGQEIILINESVGDVESSITILQQLVDQINISVQGIGGTNLLRNSVGLKGNVLEWQSVDADGNPIDARNDGLVMQTTDVINNSESGSGIYLDNEYIQQNIATIAGETYTVYLRFNKAGDLDLIIDGTTTVPIEATGISDGDWGVFKYQFVASTTTTSIRFENGSGETATLTDIIAKLGDANGWSQAPNEVYGANYKFDREGLRLTDPNSNFQAILTNESLTVLDVSGGGERIVMQVSIDAAKIANLIVQEGLTVQRYENPSKSLRIIPIDTGVMEVINT